MTPVSDNALKYSLENLKRNNPSISIVTYEPCSNAERTAKALNRTLRGNYVKHIKSYEFSKIVNGNGHFTVERFSFNRKKTITNLEKAIQGQKHRMLEIESPTIYDYFIDGDYIVLMLSSGVAHDSNSALFAQIKTDFMENHGTGKTP